MLPRVLTLLLWIALGLAAGRAAAAPPVYRFMLIEELPQPLADVRLDLNDRGEIAFNEIVGSAEFLWLRDPRGAAWPVDRTSPTLVDLELARLNDASQIVYSADFAAPDPRSRALYLYSRGAEAVEIFSVTAASGDALDPLPDLSDTGEVGFWRDPAAANRGVMHWAPDGLDADLSAAVIIESVVIARDNELAWDGRASQTAAISVIRRGYAGSEATFVSAADFAGVSGRLEPVALNEDKTLLFTRQHGLTTNVHLKRAGVVSLVSDLESCEEPELNDADQVLCPGPTHLTLHETLLGESYDLIGFGGSIASRTIQAFGTSAGLNDFGQIAFAVRFTDGTTWVVLATPESCDADDDGWCDVQDSCPAYYDPSQLDSDVDGVGDRCDNCPLHANPSQADANADGRGDACLACGTTGIPRCGVRTKPSGTDVFTIANVPVSAVPPRPRLLVLAAVVPGDPPLQLNATVTGCSGGQLSTNGSPIANYLWTGVRDVPFYNSYVSQANRVGASCTFEFQAIGPAGARYAWLIDAVTRAPGGGYDLLETATGNVLANANNSTVSFMTEASNHRFLYTGSGGASFGTCQWSPNPPTANSPNIVYSSATGPGWDCCTFQFDGLDGVPSSVGQIVFDVNGSPPPPNTDGDGYLSACDNCDHVANDQGDRGRIGNANPDGVGDACQCGELTGDGIGSAADVLRLRQHLAGSAPLAADALERCSVIGGALECTVRSLAVLRRNLALQPPLAAQVCAAALP